MKKFVFPLVLIGSLSVVPFMAVQAADWEFLGDRKVSYWTETDVIRVGHDRGQFNKIQLRVRHAGIRFFGVKVHFGNGDVFDVPIRDFIPAGGMTRAIGLPGGGRFIRKVVFRYRTGPDAHRRAVLRLWGK